MRVRVIGGPWPERIGCEGTIVDGPDRYPWHGRSKNEAIVLLDDDPLGTTREGDAPWSCAIGRRDLEAIETQHYDGREAPDGS